MKIRKATGADVAALNKLVNSAYRGDSSRQGWTTEADLLDGIRTSEAALQAMVENSEAAILVAEEDSEMAGCVYLEKKGRVLYLGMLTVAPTM
ncbi:MAG: GNAT family N-acetyltransferase, partial [Chitinophagaceae bacterium]